MWDYHLAYANRANSLMKRYKHLNTYSEATGEVETRWRDEGPTVFSANHWLLLIIPVAMSMLNTLMLAITVPFTDSRAYWITAVAVGGAYAAFLIGVLCKCIRVIHNTDRTAHRTGAARLDC